MPIEMAQNKKENANSTKLLLAKIVILVTFSCKTHIIYFLYDTILRRKAYSVTLLHT